MTPGFWDDAEIISVYTRAQAIEDGVLIDANKGDLAEVTRQHYKVPVAMTAAVFGIMRRAVENKRHCNDWRGVWHDICWMGRVCYKAIDPTTRLFRVKIIGAGRQSLYTFKAICGPSDNGSPCITVMLPDED